MGCTSNNKSAFGVVSGGCGNVLMGIYQYNVAMDYCMMWVWRGAQQEGAEVVGVFVVAVERGKRNKINSFVDLSKAYCNR